MGSAEARRCLITGPLADSSKALQAPSRVGPALVHVASWRRSAAPTFGPGLSSGTLEFLDCAWTPLAPFLFRALLHHKQNVCAVEGVMPRVTTVVRDYGKARDWAVLAQLGGRGGGGFGVCVQCRKVHDPSVIATMRDILRPRVACQEAHASLSTTKPVFFREPTYIILSRCTSVVYFHQSGPELCPVPMFSPWDCHALFQWGSVCPLFDASLRGRQGCRTTSVGPAWGPVASTAVDASLYINRNARWQRNPAAPAHAPIHTFYEGMWSMAPFVESASHYPCGRVGECPELQIARCVPGCRIGG